MTKRDIAELFIDFLPIGSGTIAVGGALWLFVELINHHYDVFDPAMLFVGFFCLFVTSLFVKNRLDKKRG